jgi:hypothetical protein
MVGVQAPVPDRIEQIEAFINTGPEVLVSSVTGHLCPHEPDLRSRDHLDCVPVRDMIASVTAALIIAQLSVEETFDHLDALYRFVVYGDRSGVTSDERFFVIQLGIVVELPGSPTLGASDTIKLCMTNLLGRRQDFRSPEALAGLLRLLISQGGGSDKLAADGLSVIADVGPADIAEIRQRR